MASKVLQTAGIPRHVLITGASSGVGAAVAKRLASATRPNHSLFLYLCGRNKENLREVSVVCGSLSPHSSASIKSQRRLLPILVLR